MSEKQKAAEKFMTRFVKKHDYFENLWGIEKAFLAGVAWRDKNPQKKVSK
jgi:hypothetical protein